MQQSSSDRFTRRNKLDRSFRYLSRLPWLAEERGLGSEEGEVFTLVVQAAVPAAHAVAAGHGRAHHCVDSHGEVLSWRQRGVSSFALRKRLGLFRQQPGRPELLCCLLEVGIPTTNQAGEPGWRSAALAFHQRGNRESAAQTCHFLLCACVRV